MKCSKYLVKYIYGDNGSMRIAEEQRNGDQ